MKSNRTSIFGNISAALAAAGMLLFAYGCEKAPAAEEPLPPIIPQPQPEIPDETGGYDENKILSHVMSFDDWAGISFTELTNPGNNRADTKVKFTSDADYIYGYIEIANTDNLIVPNITDNSGVVCNVFCPGFIKKLAVGFDLDGVGEGQGIGWMTGYCWEKVLDGDLISYTRSALTDAEKNQGWTDLWSHFFMPVESFSESLGRPGYTITPKTWNPTINESKEGVGTIVADSKDWNNVATGKGEWKDKTFRYSYTIDRERMGLKAIEEVKLTVFLYENGIDGYSVTPDAAGIHLTLNN